MKSGNPSLVVHTKYPAANANAFGEPPAQGRRTPVNLGATDASVEDDVDDKKENVQLEPETGTKTSYTTTVNMEMESPVQSSQDGGRVHLVKPEGETAFAIVENQNESTNTVPILVSSCT